jgi:hypothetical protein
MIQLFSPAHFRAAYDRYVATGDAKMLVVFFLPYGELSPRILNGVERQEMIDRLLAIVGVALVLAPEYLLLRDANGTAEAPPWAFLSLEELFKFITPTIRLLLRLLLNKRENTASEEETLLEHLIAMAKQTWHQRDAAGFAQAWDDMVLLRLCYKKLNFTWQAHHRGATTSPYFGENDLADSAKLPQFRGMLAFGRDVVRKVAPDYVFELDPIIGDAAPFLGGADTVFEKMSHDVERYNTPATLSDINVGASHVANGNQKIVLQSGSAMDHAIAAKETILGLAAQGNGAVPAEEADVAGETDVPAEPLGAAEVPVAQAGEAQAAAVAVAPPGEAGIVALWAADRAARRAAKAERKKQAKPSPAPAKPPKPPRAEPIQWTGQMDALILAGEAAVQGPGRWVTIANRVGEPWRNVHARAKQLAKMPERLKELPQAVCGEVVGDAPVAEQVTPVNADAVPDTEGGPAPAAPRGQAESEEKRRIRAAFSAAIAIMPLPPHLADGVKCLCDGTELEKGDGISSFRSNLLAGDGGTSLDVLARSVLERFGYAVLDPEVSWAARAACLRGLAEWIPRAGQITNAGDLPAGMGGLCRFLLRDLASNEPLMPLADSASFVARCLLALPDIVQEFTQMALPALPVVMPLRVVMVFGLEAASLPNEGAAGLAEVLGEMLDESPSDDDGGNMMRALQLLDREHLSDVDSLLNAGRLCCVAQLGGSSPAAMMLAVDLLE